jgi:hypothetical protein
MHILAVLATGFSISAAALLMLGNGLQPQAAPQCLRQKAAGCLLLVGLAGLQWLHVGWLLKQFDGFHSVLYVAMLYGIAPSFYFYSRQILLANSPFIKADFYHALPVVVGMALPQFVAVPGAFLIGSGYLL